MNFDIKLITDWRFLVPASVGLISLAWSVFNFVVGKITIAKITGNDLKHITADIKELKEENKQIKVDLKADLHRINLTMNRIEKKIIKRDAICEERHHHDK